MARVSVITPAYNSGQFIRETIDSVQAQTYADWEMIIVDDGSTDNTCEIIECKAAADKRIRLIRLQKNAGVSAARNEGLRVAGGRFLAFIDSDDVWLPRKLESQLQFMETKSSAFSFSQFRIMSCDGKVVGEVVEVPELVDYKKIIIIGNPMKSPTVVLDREKVGDVRFPFHSREDYLLWLNILKRGVVAHGIQEDLARVRIVANSRSWNKMRMALDTWTIYRIEKLSLHYAVWCFVNYAWHGLGKYRTFVMKTLGKRLAERTTRSGDK